MGGTLSAHSEGAGQGATFVLDIPIDPQEGDR
jgi:signal transduction histidine kinase